MLLRRFVSKILAEKLLNIFYFVCCFVERTFQIGYLDVVIPPDFIPEETSSDVIVPEGSSVKLTCRLVTTTFYDAIKTLKGTTWKILITLIFPTNIQTLSHINLSTYS